MNINWALLREQKSALVRMAMTGQDNQALDGIVNLLDNLQDEAVSSGLADEVTVFGKQETTWEEVVPVSPKVDPITMIDELRAKGYLVVAWTPQELEGIAADFIEHMEESCTRHGNELIDVWGNGNEELADYSSCPTCGEDGGTQCGAINCGY